MKLPYGITVSGRKYQASVSHNGKQVYLGASTDLDEAVALVHAFREEHPAKKVGPPPKDQRVGAPKPSLRKAINGMCKACIYDPQNGNGTWRQQIDACTSFDCPLYVVRPKSLKRKESEKDDNRKLLGDIDIRELPVSVSEEIHNEGAD